VRKLAPVELDAFLDGCRRRMREHARLVAWQVATMINLWSSQSVTVGQLLGEEDPEVPTMGFDPAAERERARAMRDAKEAADADGWDAALQLDDDTMMERLRALEDGDA
jgi:hypothetical protein